MLSRFQNPKHSLQDRAQGLTARQPCDGIPNQQFHDTMRKLLLLWETGYTNPARYDLNR